MRVLLINVTCGYGSTGRILTGIYDAYEADGNECLIAYGRGSAPEGYRAIKTGTRLGKAMHGLKSRIKDSHGFGSRAETKQLIHQIKRFNPEIIHLHNIHGYYINIEILFDYIKKAGIPVIWTLHDCWAFTGHCTHFDYAGCERWMTGCYRCPQLSRYPKSFFYDNTLRNYHRKKELFCGVSDITLVTPSKWLGAIVKKSFLSACPVFVIPNGVDLAQFKPTYGNFRKRYGLGDKKIVLGVASVWESRKGLEEFGVLSGLRDDNYKIVLVGLTKKQIRSMPEKILCIQRTESVRELAELYTAADVFVNMSVEESMGLVTVEAMACGTPVIVYNKTALPEVVGGDCGYITETNTPEEVGRLIENMREFDREALLRQAARYEQSGQYKKYAELLRGFRRD